MKAGLQRRIERERVLRSIQADPWATPWLPLLRWQHKLLRRREDPEGLVSTGVRLLLAGRPSCVIDHIDAQEPTETRGAGPWVCIDLMCAGMMIRQFAIWKATGNVYEIGRDGAVRDDPIISVTPL